MLGTTKVFEDIRVPDIDDRKYRMLTLANGLDVLLVSDAETDRSSAAMDVNVGYLYDPDDAPGLAHFLEHLLFLGTEKYPRENEYSQFLSDVGGGYSNAFTAGENTNYYFEVSSNCLEGALDRFSQFFTCPLFDESCTDRELNAVHSEHTKNLQEDDWRIQQLEQDLSKEGHVYRKFGTGNLDTLKNIPESKGLKTREMCIEFYQTYYSSNIMKLCILGKESLDQLQMWAESMFSGIVNKNIIPRKFHDHPLGANELGKLIRVKPVKDTQMLTLSFPWPDTTNIYKKSPNKYICHLIGHESEGSILSLLKHQGLASDLSCFPSHGASGFDFFKVQVFLSDKGLEQWESVVLVIFQYIQMLKETDALDWVYEENSIMSTLAFKYQEKSDVSSYCSGLAASMHDYDKADVLCGAYLMDDFDATLIKSMIDLLRADSCRIMLVAPSAIKSEEPKVALWYGTEYQVEPFPTSLVDSLSTLVCNADLTIPQVNPFIPHKFYIEPSESIVHEHPRIIKDTPTTRLWHLLDTKYKVPRTSVTLFIKSPVAYASPRFAVLTHLYCDLVTDALNQQSYLAEMADLYFGLDVTVEGIILSIGGYSDKLGVFMATVVQAMTSLVVIPERFKFVKEELSRHYTNFESENPDQHASYFVTWMLQEKLNRSYIPVDIVNFYPTLLNPVHIEAFVHGTFDKAASLDLLAMVEDTLGKSSSLRPVPVYARYNTVRTHMLPFQSSLTYRRLLPNAENLNNAVEVYIQFGESNRDNVAKALLLNQIISEPCFDILRTKEQLGYVAWCGPRFATGVCGFLVHVQSEKHPVFVEGRILSFLENARGIIATLSDDEFQRHCTTLCSKIMQKHKYLMASTEYYWEKISNGSYDFTRREQNAETVMTLTQADMLQFYDSFVAINSSSRSKLSVQIWSSQGIKSAENVITSDLKNICSSDEKSGEDMMDVDTVLTDDGSVAEMRNQWLLGRSGYPMADIRTFYSF
ncbi:insulin-degrading enzyme [Rhizoclosmatium globosum]|uniref:Insulin-degrading enzyme n=1 Tax=Rhizoclosmatium globosum TaxID=329046 RepID=A0A1Y2CH64_9FUNG|nr:insulin-degrading enzyme [Rhizoclosmatium globosum]|eukprot:ORY46352.1 insulin-degrading enzyme [Rhizoclosmatium globosum]